MAYAYELQAATITTASPYQTSATPDTLIDFMFVKAGNTRVNIYAARLCGRGAGLTAISGITGLFKYWTTASTAGTAMTPVPLGKGAALASLATAAGGASGGTGAVTPGSGGGLFSGGFGCGAATPGAWTANSPDDYKEMAGASAASFDWYSNSGLASLLFEWWLNFYE
jgi:hypothetical protein